MSATDDRRAFERYLDVVNRALAQVRGRFPYDTVVRSLARELAGRPFVVSVIGSDGESGTRLGCTFDDGRLRWVAPIPATPVARWAIGRAHMYAVLDEPWRYLADPARIELPPLGLVGQYACAR